MDAFSSSPVIAVIGAGNMGSSLIEGLVHNHYPPASLWACDHNENKLAALKNLSVHTTTHHLEAIQSADIILLAVKPASMEAVVEVIAPKVSQHKPLILSIAAGISIERMQTWLKNPAAIVRAMPNTPACIGCGATALFANTHVTSQQHEWAEFIMRAVGMVVWLPHEALMDTVTALSGSGPAYFFLMMEALEAAATRLGLPVDIAHLLTLETALGAVRMAIESGRALSELRHQVTSPQGTTEKAISVLENNHIRDLFYQALLAAKLRSEELGK